MPAFVHTALQTVKSNAPEILTAAGITGVVTTSYLAGKASYRASELMRGSDIPEDRKERVKEYVKHTWRLYIPAGICGAVTIGCIVAASKGNGRRTAAAVAAYSVTEKAFSEYREKVVEQIGVNKEQKIRDEITQERVARYPTTSREVIVVGGGHVLCCEQFTNRYFRSDHETIRQAVNEINSRIIHSMYVSLSEFYDLLGLPHTSVSDNLGWDSDRLLDLNISSVFAEGGEPCLAFDYNYTKPLK